MRPIYLLYDERMQLHDDKRDDDSSDDDSTEENERDDDDEVWIAPVENPQRIARIYHRLMELQSRIIEHRSSSSTVSICQEEEQHNIEEPFIRLPCPLASKETIELVHSSVYYEKMFETSSMSSSELKLLPTIDCTKNCEDNESEEEDDEDMYFCKHTFEAASLACGGVVESVNAVTGEDSKSTRALALVRPPSHHACAEKAMGFCFFNSVVVAAKHAIHTKRAKRVLILDWDIHHGNGSQDLTYDDGNIMYISLHRFANGTKTSDPFFPGTGKPSEVGVVDTDAHGMNINIAWLRGGMGNTEYGAAFSEVILPIVSKFSPDLILISCGLDAADGDLLGDCLLTPSMYYLMTQSLIMTVGSETPTVVLLEGGYSLDVISDCMEAVAIAMVDVENDQIYQEGRNPQDRKEHEFPILRKGDENAGEKPNQVKNRLALGRKIMSNVWDHGTKNTFIHSSAVRDINKTIQALSSTQWEADVKPLKVVNNFLPTRMTTRSKSKKSEAGADDNDLSAMLKELNI